MSRNTAAYLFDMAQAAQAIREFSEGRTYAQYCSDLLLRSGVERQFEIMGEALNQLGKFDPTTQKRISNYQNIISFRNVLIHGYAELDDELVWDAITNKLPLFEQEVMALLDELG